MPFYDREEKILGILTDRESVNVSELSEKLYISLPTIRRDLIKLENKGKIVRNHGKVSLVKKAGDTEIPFIFREQEQYKAKSIIAEKASRLITDSNIIMLDGTTSAYHLIPYLSDFRDLVVITSGTRASYYLGQLGIRNICTGGRMVDGSFSYVGDDCIRTVMNYNADILFFSCRGLSYDGYLSDNSLDENTVRRAMMKRAKKKVLLCDSSKIGKTYLNNLCHISEVDEVICENELPKELRELLNK